MSLFLALMHLLVTGGCGFIGSHVLDHVLAQPEVAHVVNLDCLTYAGRLENAAAAARSPKYRFEQVDLRDHAAVLRVVREHALTHVIHCAAESHVDRSIAGPADFIHSNITGTFHLLEACRAAWSSSEFQVSGSALRPRFVQVSTDEVFGSLGPTGHFTETSPYAPSSPYSASKAAADHLVRAYHRTYGLDAIITHRSNNYGPRQYPEKFIPVVIHRAVARQPIPIYGDGLHTRDWLHVADHARGLWLALTCGRAGESYCLGADNEWSNLRLAERLCDLVDELAPHLGGNTRRLLTPAPDRPGHDRRYAMGTTKSHRHLRWSPARSFVLGIGDLLKGALVKADQIKQNNDSTIASPQGA